MSLFEIFVIAIALAIDAFSVALVVSIKGCCSAKHILRMASIFGFFQFFMPLLGFFLFSQLYNIIENYAHWFAFVLLVGIGGKMLWDGCTYTQEENAHCNNTFDPTKGITALTLAIATSIDALAMGGTFASLHMEIWSPAAIIGIVCFILTALGMILSRCLLQKNTYIVKYSSIMGGVVLIIIACRILFPKL